MDGQPDNVSKLNEASESLKDNHIFEIDFYEKKQFDNQEFNEYQESNNF